MDNLPFKHLVFAGGGNRCFWQAGFIQTVRHEVPLHIQSVASVSAGSAISCALFANKIEETLEVTKQEMASNPKNRYWKNLFNEHPVHPHSALYRKMIHKAIGPNDLETLKQGPENNILLAHIPKWLGPRSATTLGILAYQLEKKLFSPVHPEFGRKLGFQSEFVKASECRTVDELSDIILSSSCTPPFTPIMYRGQKPVLDGGMIDNVPVHGLSHETGEILVLLTRPYKKLPQIEKRTYIQPSRKVDVDSWDYTSPNKVQSTYDLGCQDALTFLREWQTAKR